MAEKIYKGSDENISLELYQDEAQTTAIDIDALDELYVYVAVGRNILAKYSKAGTGDFSLLRRIDAENYYLWLETDNTMPSGFVDLWVSTAEAETELTDSIQDTIAVTEKILELKPKVW